MADQTNQKGPSASDGPRQQEQQSGQHQQESSQSHSPASPQPNNSQRPPLPQYYTQQQQPPRHQNTQHQHHPQQQYGHGGVQQPYQSRGPNVPSNIHREQYSMDSLMQGYQQPDYRQHAQYGAGSRGGNQFFHTGARPPPGSRGQLMHPGPQTQMQTYYIPQQPQMMPQHYYGGHVQAMQQATSPTEPRHGGYGYGYFPNQTPTPNYYYTQPSQYTHQQQHISHNHGPFGGPLGGAPSSSPFTPRRSSQPTAATAGGRQEGAEPLPKSKQRSHQGQGQILPKAATVVRGPPRKPKQSGHAIWIGNLPPQTDLMSLVHHVCQQTAGLESLFLISKSNCAFANYPDEERCLEAQQKINDSYYMSVRLVSRLRKSSVESAQGATAPTGPSALTQPPLSPRVDGRQADGAGLLGDGADTADARVDTEKPRKSSVQTSVIVNGSDKSGTKGRSYEGGEWAASSTPVSSGSDVSTKSDKYFILKSLTLEDLELSVRTGLWATQSHNEETLNNAYKSCDNVYLIFSANKSGEYFGYARMTSEINQDPAAAIEFAPTSQSFDDADLPKAIPTEATETTPRGRIIDDSARGTIFWEVQSESADDQEDDDTGAGGHLEEAGVLSESADNISSVEKVGGVDGVDGLDGMDGVDGVDGADGTGESQTWGKPFQVEWLSTTRLPFYRTRGLRNPLNANREIKIARDGTDVDVAIGRKLVSLFHQEATSSPAAGSGSGSSSGGRAGMPSSSSYSSLPGTRTS